MFSLPPSVLMFLSFDGKQKKLLFLFFHCLPRAFMFFLSFVFLSFFLVAQALPYGRLWVVFHQDTVVAKVLSVHRTPLLVPVARDWSAHQPIPWSHMRYTQKFSEHPWFLQGLVHRARWLSEITCVNPMECQFSRPRIEDPSSRALALACQFSRLRNRQPGSEMPGCVCLHGDPSLPPNRHGWFLLGDRCGAGRLVFLLGRRLDLLIGVGVGVEVAEEVRVPSLHRPVDHLSHHFSIICVDKLLGRLVPRESETMVIDIREPRAERKPAEVVLC